MTEDEKRKLKNELNACTSITEIAMFLDKYNKKLTKMKKIAYKSVPNIKLSTDSYEYIEDVDNAQLGKLFKMIFLYTMDRNQIAEKQQQLFTFYNADPELRHLFKLFRKQLDTNIDNYAAIRKRNAENGCKGGRPRTRVKVIRDYSNDVFEEEYLIQEPPTSKLKQIYPAISMAQPFDYNISYEYGSL